MIWGGLSFCIKTGASYGAGPSNGLGYVQMLQRASLMTKGPHLCCKRLFFCFLSLMKDFSEYTLCMFHQFNFYIE